ARQRHAGNLAAAEQTFRPMTAEDRQAARPWQIRVVPMPRGGFAELQRQSVVSVEQLRLLNGVYGGGREPAAGQRVKTVVAGR
ncbi:MAG: peptidase, partial [Hydrogenophaga sp.]